MISFYIRFESLSKTVSVPPYETAVVNFTLQRINVGEKIRLSIPPSPGRMSSSTTTVLPPSKAAHLSSNEIENLLKKKLKQAPSLLCLYR